MVSRDVLYESAGKKQLAVIRRVSVVCMDRNGWKIVIGWFLTIASKNKWIYLTILK